MKRSFDYMSYLNREKYERIFEAEDNEDTDVESQESDTQQQNRRYYFERKCYGGKYTIAWWNPEDDDTSLPEGMNYIDGFVFNIRDNSTNRFIYNKPIEGAIVPLMEDIDNDRTGGEYSLRNIYYNNYMRVKTPGNQPIDNSKKIFLYDYTIACARSGKVTQESEMYGSFIINIGGNEVIVGDHENAAGGMVNGFDLEPESTSFFNLAMSVKNVYDHDWDEIPAERIKSRERIDNIEFAVLNIDKVCIMMGADMKRYHDGMFEVVYVGPMFFPNGIKTKDCFGPRRYCTRVDSFDGLRYTYVSYKSIDKLHIPKVIMTLPKSYSGSMSILYKSKDDRILEIEDAQDALLFPIPDDIEGIEEPISYIAFIGNDNGMLCLDINGKIIKPEDDPRVKEILDIFGNYDYKLLDSMQYETRLTVINEIVDSCSCKPQFSLHLVIKDETDDGKFSLVTMGYDFIDVDGSNIGPGVWNAKECDLFKDYNQLYWEIDAKHVAPETKHKKLQICVVGPFAGVTSSQKIGSALSDTYKYGYRSLGTHGWGEANMVYIKDVNGDVRIFERYFADVNDYADSYECISAKHGYVYKDITTIYDEFEGTSVDSIGSLNAVEYCDSDADKCELSVMTMDNGKKYIILNNDFLEVDESTGPVQCLMKHDGFTFGTPTYGMSFGFSKDGKNLFNEGNAIETCGLFWRNAFLMKSGNKVKLFTGSVDGKIVREYNRLYDSNHDVGSSERMHAQTDKIDTNYSKHILTRDLRSLDCSGFPKPYTVREFDGIYSYNAYTNCDKKSDLIYFMYPPIVERIVNDKSYFAYFNILTGNCLLVERDKVNDKLEEMWFDECYPPVFMIKNNTDDVECCVVFKCKKAGNVVYFNTRKNRTSKRIYKDDIVLYTILNSLFETERYRCDYTIKQTTDQEIIDYYEEHCDDELDKDLIC